MTLARPISVEPFALREGQVYLEDVLVADLVDGLHGREAWLISHAAIAAGLEAELAGGARAVAVAVIGPRVVLAQCAAAGCWARAASSHELELAREAGFRPERIIASGAVVEDGLLRDALAAGVAVIERPAGEGEDNLQRIAAALGHPVPPSSGAPPDLPDALFARSGGLLAPVLATPPALALDAVWEPPARGGAPLPPDGPVVLSVSLAGVGAPEAERAITVRGLGPSPPQPARLAGPRGARELGGGRGERRGRRAPPGSQPPAAPARDRARRRLAPAQPEAPAGDAGALTGLRPPWRAPAVCRPGGPAPRPRPW